MPIEDDYWQTVSAAASIIARYLPCPGYFAPLYRQLSDLQGAPPRDRRSRDYPSNDQVVRSMFRGSKH